MLAPPLALALALTTLAGTPSEPSSSDEPTVAAALAPEAAVTAVEGEGTVEETQSRRRRARRQPRSEGLDPMLTRAAQVGVGVGTCAICGGLSCLTSTGVGFVLTPLLVVPLLSTFVIGGLEVLLCGATGAAVGGAETLTGNWLGREEADFLWPVLAGAGVGAGSSALLLGVNVASYALNLGADAPTLEPGAPVDPNAVLAATNPLAAALSLAALGVCTAGCIAIPVVPVLVYGLVAEPKAAEGVRVDGQESPLPKAAVRTAMAY